MIHLNLFCESVANFCRLAKGQLISKGLFGILNSPKKRTKKIAFTTMIYTSDRLVYIHFLGEIEDTKKTFRN